MRLLKRRTLTDGAIFHVAGAKKTRADLFRSCLVPVRRFPSHFRLDHVTRNALAARNNEPRD